LAKRVVAQSMSEAWVRSVWVVQIGEEALQTVPEATRTLSEQATLQETPEWLNLPVHHQTWLQHRASQCLQVLAAFQLLAVVG
jgi:hypothetical protein